MSRTQLDVAGVARHLGKSVRTVQTLRQRGQLAPEDGVLGRSPWWWVETIDEWQRGRPGQGAGGGRPRKPRA